MFLLDTQVVLEARRTRPDIAVVNWLERTPADALFICAASIGLLRGLIEGVRGHDPARADVIAQWVDRLSATTAIVPLGARAFSQWSGLIQGGQPKNLFDTMVGATALAHGMTVATKNVATFAEFGAATFNPYEISLT